MHVAVAFISASQWLMGMTLVCWYCWLADTVVIWNVWTTESDGKPSSVVNSVIPLDSLLSITSSVIVALGYIFLRNLAPSYISSFLCNIMRTLLVMFYFDCVDKAQWLVIFGEILQLPRPADHCMFAMLHIVWYTSSRERRSVVAQYIWRAWQIRQSCRSCSLANSLQLNACRYFVFRLDQGIGDCHFSGSLLDLSLHSGWPLTGKPEIVGEFDSCWARN